MAFTIGQKLLASQLNDFNPSGDVNPGDDIALGSGGVVTWAGDTNLQRSGAAILRTDGDFQVAAGISVPRGYRMRGRRDTASTTTTTIAGVLRLDDQAVQTGRGYIIGAAGLFGLSTVNSDRVLITLRYTTDGSTPTTSSSILPAGEAYQWVHIFSTQAGETMGTIMAYYAPAADQTLSVLLCVARSVGSGNVNLYADTDHKIDLWIEDVGAAISDTGTDI